MRLLIFGRVQGVGYRAWAARNALKRELHGLVCNRKDGSVEMVISGEEVLVQSMIGVCRDGPLGAHVMNLEISSYNYREVLPRFIILDNI